MAGTAQIGVSLSSACTIGAWSPGAACKALFVGCPQHCLRHFLPCDSGHACALDSCSHPPGQSCARLCSPPPVPGGPSSSLAPLVAFSFLITLQSSSCCPGRRPLCRARGSLTTVPRGVPAEGLLGIRPHWVGAVPEGPGKPAAGAGRRQTCLNYMGER